MKMSQEKGNLPSWFRKGIPKIFASCSRDSISSWVKPGMLKLLVDEDVVELSVTAVCVVVVVVVGAGVAAATLLIWLRNSSTEGRSTGIVGWVLEDASVVVSLSVVDVGSSSVTCSLAGCTVNAEFQLWSGLSGFRWTSGGWTGSSWIPLITGNPWSNVRGASLTAAGDGDGLSGSIGLAGCQDEASETGGPCW